jgi:Na+/H+ antiporter NhaC
MTHSTPRLVFRGVGLSLILAAPFTWGEAVEEPGPSAADLRAELRQGEPPLRVTPPRVAVSGIDASVAVELTGLPGVSETPVEIRDGAGTVLARARLVPGVGATMRLEQVRGSGPYHVFLPELHVDGVPFSLRVIPGWLTLFPALLAIALALLFRQVVPALVAGVWVGAWIVAGGPFSGALRTIDGYVIHALADADHVSIIVFSLMLGGMVGIMARAGGTVGLVEALRPYATNTRRGQIVTWIMGILIFFDDYANTLLVGNTMRPVTDRLRISREKLAYIVDSTAAPVASVALISTWIGYEVSLIADSLERLGSDLDGYAVFVQSLPYRFYPILALCLGLMVAIGLRDLGPMLKAERRARAGKLLADKAVPLSDFDADALSPVAGKSHRWINAVLPVLVVLAVTLAALWLSGRQSLIADGDPRGTTSLLRLGIQGIGGVLGAGNSFHALLYGSLAGCLTALGLVFTQRILSLGESMNAWVAGVKSMTVAIVILVLAWSLADVCTDLDTSGFMVAGLSDHLDPRFVPVLVFLVAALTSFATGTSWGTMGILVPLAVPTAFGVAQAAGFDAEATHRILLGAVSSVLAGAIFGDHCSPISDTTVLSSMASGCDHVDHVRTQLPYAVLVAVIGMLLGDLPSSFGVSPYVCLLVACAALASILGWAGRPVEP